MKRGFTLVELLVVIAIIGLLVALMLSAIQQAREAARRMQCQKNLREIGTAIANFESSRKVFPAARRGSDTYCYNGTPPGKEDKYHYGSSGFVTILPYLEQTALFTSLKDGEILPGTTTAADLDEVKPYAQERPSIFVCPSNDSEPTLPSGAAWKSYTPEWQVPDESATGTYAFCAGDRATDASYLTKLDNTGVFCYYVTRSVSDVKDGLSNTFFVGEVTKAHRANGRNVWFFSCRNRDGFRTTYNPVNSFPGEDPCDTSVTPDGKFETAYGAKINSAFSSNHSGGAEFSYGDSHVAWVDDLIDTEVYRALSTRAGNEAVDENKMEGDD